MSGTPASPIVVNVNIKSVYASPGYGYWFTLGPAVNVRGGPARNAVRVSWFLDQLGGCRGFAPMSYYERSDQIVRLLQSTGLTDGSAYSVQELANLIINCAIIECNVGKPASDDNVGVAFVKAAGLAGGDGEVSGSSILALALSLALIGGAAYAGAYYATKRKR